MPPKLGILAGGGVLPRRLIDAARTGGRDVFVIAFPDQTDETTVENVPHKWLRLGAAGDMISALKEQGVEELVMGGGIRRPSLKELRPDWLATKFLARHALSSLGDDGLLKAVRQELERLGFRLIGPQDVLADLLTSPGYLGEQRMSIQDEQDLARGRAILQALSPHDVGQAVIVQQGLVLGIEAIEGTAALIARAGMLRREGEGGLLVKLAKTEQDNLMDLPAIGPDSINQMQQAGLGGIVIEAGRSIILDRAETISRANAAKIFLYGMPVNE